MVNPRSDKSIASRIVKSPGDDYARKEYGLTALQLERVENRILSQIQRERKTGKLKAWKQ